MVHGVGVYFHLPIRVRCLICRQGCFVCMSDGICMGLEVRCFGFCLVRGICVLGMRRRRVFAPRFWKPKDVCVHAHVLADASLVKAVCLLSSGERLLDGGGDVLAVCVKEEMPVVFDISDIESEGYVDRHYEGSVRFIKDLSSLLTFHVSDMDRDACTWVRRLREGGKEVHQGGISGCDCFGDAIFHEGDFVGSSVVLDSRSGAIVIGKGVKIGSFSMIEGPVCLAAGSVVMPRSHIRGSTCIGEGSKVGGELSSSLLGAYTNKSHEGFMGHSILGSWCNIGAGTTTSNLKNTYGDVSLFDVDKGDYIDSGRQFCGLFMGDYTKSAILQRFNTGTVIGPFCHVHSAGFAPRHMGPFCWMDKDSVYTFDKAMEGASRMMERRGKRLSVHERELYRHIFAETWG